jgi:protein-disulfide isomerase
MIVNLTASDQQGLPSILGLPIAMLPALGVLWLSACHPSKEESKPSAPAKAASRTNALCEQVVSMVCSEIGEKSAVCGLMKRSSARMDAARCREMLNDRDRTIADLKQMEASRMPLGEDKQLLLTEGNPPTLGPVDAEVTVVLFTSFHCEPCIFMAYTARQMVTKYPDKVRLVIRHRPSSRSPLAHLAAQASMAAHAQGRFWDYYKQLYNNQHDINRATIERCAREIDLDMKPFLKALTSERYRETVDADLALAERVTAGQAPYFFVNGERVEGIKSQIKLEATIEKAISGSGPKD